MQSSWFCISLCFFLFTCAFSSAFASASSSIVFESSPTITAKELYSKLSFFTSYYTGGESLIGKLPQDTTFYYFVKKYARLQIQEHCKTNDTGVYEVRGYLLIQFPYWYGGDPPQGDHQNHAGSRGASRARGSLRFWLKGLWSERSRQLLLLGTASWVVEGKPIILDAVLDLNYTAKDNPTLYTGYISGTFKSLVSAIDPGYFDPFSIFSFPTLPIYNYSLLSHVHDTFSTEFDVRQNQLPSYEGSEDCWVIMGESILMDVEYAADCNEHQHCSPFGIGSLPRLLLLVPIQCSAAERKMRYMATFQNTRYDQGFGLNSTVIGEASWDDNKKELVGIAYRLFDPLNRSADEVGDCTMRVSMRYTSIFTIRNDPKLVGRFRSTRHVDKSGYFRKMNLTKSDGYGLITLLEVRYEYTKLDEVRQSCTAKMLPLKRGNTYPHVHSDNMRFDLSVENSKSQHFAWISASPLWIGNDLYQKKNISESMTSMSSNISYMITMSSSSELEFYDIFSSLNWSINANHEVEITAEGVYNAETGSLCMVGCRKLEPYGKSSTYIDCEILVKLEFPPLNGKRGVRTKGTITSTRAKTDPLHFNDMLISSASYYAEEAAHEIWRMDVEIAMVLMSNTLICIFVVIQINHVKRYSKVQSSISLFMLLILSMGHMIPLILNLEERHPFNEVKVIYHGGRLEGNEVTVRLSYLVALLLQIRLLQLVWTAKLRDEIGERKAGYVLLLLYFIGGSACSVIARRVWGGLRSYAGLIMDGFLLPQVLLNAFRGSPEKALSGPFYGQYGGISAVRVAPHAYNLYRAYYYPASDLKKAYYYANPDVGFYSRAWDIVVPFGIITLVVIVFLQQRHRGYGLAL